MVVASSSAEDLLVPVRSSDAAAPDAEEVEAGEKTSTTQLASEASLKPTGTLAAAGDEKPMTVPRTIGLIGAISFIVGTIIGLRPFLSLLTATM